MYALNRWWRLMTAQNHQREKLFSSLKDTSQEQGTESEASECPLFHPFSITRNQINKTLFKGAQFKTIKTITYSTKPTRQPAVNKEATIQHGNIEYFYFAFVRLLLILTRRRRRHDERPFYYERRQQTTKRNEELFWSFPLVLSASASPKNLAQRRNAKNDDDNAMYTRKRKRKPPLTDVTVECKP